MKLKQNLKLAMLVLPATILQSCKSVSKFSSGKTLDIAAVVNQKPTLADLEVKDVKVSGTASYKSTEKGFEAIKQEAVANALKSVNADILVEPKFDTEIKNFTTTVSVSGYPAFYKNFRPIKTEDLPVLESLLFHSLPISNVSTPHIPTSNPLNNTITK